jgi:limonene-1,2-epoxide hydrolase
MNRKSFVLQMAGLTLVLTMGVACSAVQPAPTSSTAQTRAVVDAFVSAYGAKDAAKYIALFDNDATYLDNGLGSYRALGPMYVRNMQTAIVQTFAEKDFRVDLDSSFVSTDGRFAAIECVYTNVGKESKVVSAPMVIILEVKGNKIIKEIDYYDGSQFE